MRGKHDGEVTISTALDNDGIEKDMQEISGEFGGLKKVLANISKAISGALSKPAGEACAQIRKDLSATEKQIKRYQQQIQKSENAKLPLLEEAQQLGVELDAAKGKLAQLQAQQQAAGDALSSDTSRPMSSGEIQAYVDAYQQKPQLDSDVAQQQAQVDALQAKWDAVNNKIDAYDYKIDQANREMEAQKANAGELNKKLDAAEKETKQIKENVSGSKKGFGALGKAVDSVTSRLRSIALGAFLFNGISAGLRELTSYFGDTLKTSESFNMELSKLKGALLTAFQPIYNVIAPALIYMMQWLTEATVAVAKFFAMLSGTTIQENAKAAQSLYKEAKALDEVGKSAKSAGKSLAGFDQLNVLQAKNTGGTGTSTDKTAPSFNFEENGMTKVAQIIEKIAGYVPIIATGLLGWKIGTFLGDLLKVEGILKNLSLTAGVTLSVIGVTLEAKGIISSIQEGLNSINFAEIVSGGGILTAGAALIGSAFGELALGTGIGAIIAGVPMYFTGIYDACVNGLNWLNSVLIPIGAALTGTGIGTIIGTAVGSLTGPIGAGVGALIGLCVGLLTDAFIFIWQHFDAVEAWFNDLPLLGKIVVGAFAVVLEMITFCVAPILAIGAAVIFVAKKFDDVVAVVKNVAANIIDYFRPVGEWLSEMYQSFYQTAQDVFYNIGVIVSGCWESIKYGLGIASSWVDENVIQPIAGFFSDLWDGISAWATDAWAKIKEVFAPAAEWIQSKVIDPINKALDALKGGMKDLINGFIGFLNSGWEKIIGSINKPLTALKNLKMGDIQPFAEIKTISVPKIPYLAQGAVLPPNKPFMAVVGDQRHGTNIEAPLATIQEAVALVMQDYAASNLAGHEATVAVLRDILEAVLGIQIGDDVIGNAVARYNAKQAIVRGGVL